MTNREWLSKQPLNKQISELENLIESYMGTSSYSSLTDTIYVFLCSPRATTADEEFLEMGFDLDEEKGSMADYSDAFGRSFSIWKKDIRFKTCSDPLKIWNNRDIDEVRAIANKKRKELEWNTI